MFIHHGILLVIALQFAMVLLFMLSQKLNVSYPIFLVIGGLLIGFLPGVPRIALHPDIAFLLFLPPLLYEAAWFTTWHNFWRWRRSIVSLALGLVILTSVAVALVSTALIPGFTLALGFLLGGIISPPDAVSATSVLKGVQVPKRLMTILEGESLINGLKFDCFSLRPRRRVNRTVCPAKSSRGFLSYRDDGDSDGTRRGSGVLWLSPIPANYPQHRHAFDDHGSLSDVFDRRAISFFRRAGGGQRRPVFVHSFAPTV